MRPDIETAFHTSLDRLLRGEATLDACVAAYPEHDERLRDMLVVALDLQALAPLPLDRRAVERGARLIDDEVQRLRARLDRQPEPASAWQRLTWWFPRYMPVRMAGLAAAFAIALIAYGGVTLAAVNSGPDSALYGYRLTLEELRIGFATDEEKAYHYLDTAEQRLREIESAAGLGDAVAVARASTAYQEVVRKGVNVLGAVARGPEPDADRTGEVAADYRRRLAEHDTRFNSLSNTAAAAERAPISRARSRVQAGLQDVHSGPILAAAPTAAPDVRPAATAAAPAPVASPSPTPAVILTAPVSPTPVAPPAAPTPAPAPVAGTPASEVTPEPTAAAPAVPAIDITGSAVVVTGELLAVTDDSLVVAGISIARGEVAAVDGVPLTARVRAEALVAADGILTLVGLSVVQPAPGASEEVADSQPPAAPDPSPSPEPAPGESTPPTDGTPPAVSPTPETSPTPDPAPGEGTPAADASPTPSPAEGEAAPTPDTAPGQDTTPGEGSPTSESSPSPTPVEGEPSATPEATPTPESTPDEGAPPATEESQVPSDPSPTPTPADGAPSPTPEATPSSEATPPEATPPPTDEPQPTPEPSATPEAEPTPDPTPSEGAPPATPEATPTPAEDTPPAGETPPPNASPTPTPVGAEPPATPETTPTPDAETPLAPAPPTLRGVLVALDSFTVRAGGIVFSRPLDTPLVLHGPMSPGDVVVVTFEALRAASSYVLVAREVAPIQPPDGPAVRRWQGFVDELAPDALTLNGVRLQVAPAAREDDVWASLEVGDLVEVDLGDAAVAEPVATAVRLLGSGAAQSFSNLAGLPQG